MKIPDVKEKLTFEEKSGNLIKVKDVNCFSINEVNARC